MNDEMKQKIDMIEYYDELRKNKKHLATIQPHVKTRSEKPTIMTGPDKKSALLAFKVMTGSAAVKEDKPKSKIKFASYNYKDCVPGMSKSKLYDLHIAYEKDFKARIGADTGEGSPESGANSDEELQPHEATDRQQKMRFQEFRDDFLRARSGQDRADPKAFKVTEDMPAKNNELVETMLTQILKENMVNKKGKKMI
jgi:hypothetical protein